MKPKGGVTKVNVTTSGMGGGGGGGETHEGKKWRASLLQILQ